MKKLKLSKKLKRTLAYVGIIGGCGVLALSFFTGAQYAKAKYDASQTMELTAKRYVDKAEPIYLEDPKSEASWWKGIYDYFAAETEKNSKTYVGLAIPAYTFSMATLVAFGLVLKHAEKTKEKEEKEV